MADPIILAESGALIGAQPYDVIPETVHAEMEYSAPVVMHKLSGGLTDFDNTVISAQFRTNDDRDDSSLAFITIARSGPDDGAEYCHYYNGYGIALRPVNDATKVNLFIVDNSLADKNVVLENVVHTGWGDYAYLAATHVDLTYDTTYNIKIEFLSSGGLNCYLWEDGSSIPLVPAITYGAYQRQSDGSYWGVSHSHTGGYTWSWPFLQMVSKNANYAMHYYRMSTDGMVDSVIAKAYAFGSGNKAGILGYGIELMAYNQITETWDSLDTHDYSTADLLSSGELPLLTYGTASHPVFVELLLTSMYPSDYALAIDSKLYVDYVWIEDWDTAAAHVGGRGDIYVRESSQPQSSYMDIMNCDLYELLDHSNSKITTSDFLLPAVWFINVELLDALGNPTGTFIDPINYSFSSMNESTRFSTDEITIIRLAAPGWNIRIHYWTYSNITAAQDYCDQAIHRNLTDELLVKAAQPYELYISCSLSGTAIHMELRTLLAQYINTGLKSTLTTTELTAFLQDQDFVTDVDGLTFYAIKHEFDCSSTNIYTINGSMTITDVQQFVLIPDGLHVNFV